MSNAFAKAAIVVGAVALVATGVGAAGGLGIIAATTASTIGTLASVGAGLLGLAATVTRKAPSTSASGDQTRLTLNKDQGIPYILGRTGVAGWPVHRQTFDHAGSKPANAFQTIFGVWGGGGPIEGVESYQVEGGTVTFAGDVATGAYSGSMWLQTQLGAVTDPALHATGFYPYPAGWSAASKMTGYAGFALTMKYDEKGKVYPSGVPKVLAVLKGARAWDPRLDDTYPGGVGPVRWADESTWPYTENPWLHAITWARGRFQNGKRVLGIGMALTALDVPAMVSAANVADVNEWTVGGVVYSTDGKYDILKKIMAAGGGEPLQLGGQLSCLVNKPRAPLATITTADIIGRASVTGTQASRDRINGIIPTYRSEEHDWSLVPGELVRVGTYLEEDGKPRTRAQTWELVQDKDQVAELAAYEIANSREFGPIITPLKLKAAGYKPGDCLHLASPELGMDGQDIVVTKRHFDPTSGAVTLTSRSETYAKHAFCLGETGTAPPTPSLQVIDRTTLPTPGYDANWSGIADDEGTKPEDNATVGAPAGTNVAGVPAELVAQRTAAVGDLIDITVPDITGRIDEIFDERLPGLTADISAINETKLPDLSDRITVEVLDREAAGRQIAAAEASVADTLLRAIAEAERTRTAMRDAGIYIDPLTGKARLYATDQQAERLSQVTVALDAVSATLNLKATVNYVQEQIALAVLDPSQVADLTAIIARLTSAEIALDGLNATIALKADAATLTGLSAVVTSLSTQYDALAGTITTKADQTTVDALSTTLSAIESTLGSYGDVSSFDLTIRRLRAERDASDTTLLRDILSDDASARSVVTQQADVHFQLTSTIVAGLSAEAASRLRLAAQMAGGFASVDQQVRALVTADSVTTEQITVALAALGQQASLISQLAQQQISAGTSIAGLSTTIRQASFGDDLTADAALRAIVSGDEDARTARAQVAQIQFDLTTTIVAGFSAEASARLSLAARTGQAEAAIISAQQALTSLTQATTSRLDAAESRLGAAEARIVAEEGTRASAIEAEAFARQALAAIVNDPGTGLAKTRADLYQQVSVFAGENEARAQEIAGLSAQVNDPATGLPRTRADLFSEQTARADGDGANATAISGLSAQVNHPATGLPATLARVAQEETARADGDSANATAIAGLSAQVNDPATGLPKTRADLFTEQNARADGDSANATAVALVAAQVNDPATGLAKTRADVSTEALARANGDSANAQAISAVQAAAGGLSADVVSLQAAYADAAGKLTARFQQIASVGGVYAGVRAIVQLEDGSFTSDLALLGSSIGLWLQSADGSFTRALGLELVDGEPVAMFYGRLLANSIEADMLTDNSAVVPVIARVNAGLVGQGRQVWQTALTRTIGVKKRGVVTIGGSVAVVGFTAPQGDWAFRITIDGNAREYGALDNQQIVPLYHARECAPGDREIKIEFAATASATLLSIDLQAFGFNATTIQ
ncbi:hypothetical protein PQ455_01420 [Sphingomonas naphthae]|uniref:Tip attachment protein J domain-containing protein n=1 Tax=Sphingomonas naphthae TaxID=1813468 RepID=A0ABY7TLU9_9SPHN|nr:hypothetical protein [Sphingomonas naphthae]WCT73920.1 hypothetical protein PQ455_01420 [Sphingomonas naphthae]